MLLYFDHIIRLYSIFLLKSKQLYKRKPIKVSCFPETSILVIRNLFQPLIFLSYPPITSIYSLFPYDNFLLNQSILHLKITTIENYKTRLNKSRDQRFKSKEFLKRVHVITRDELTIALADVINTNVNTNYSYDKNGNDTRIPR